MHSFMYFFPNLNTLLFCVHRKSPLQGIVPRAATPGTGRVRCAILSQIGVGDIIYSMHNQNGGTAIASPRLQRLPCARFAFLCAVRLAACSFDSASGQPCSSLQARVLGVACGPRHTRTQPTPHTRAQRRHDRGAPPPCMPPPLAPRSARAPAPGEQLSRARTRRTLTVHAQALELAKSGKCA